MKTIHLFRISYQDLGDTIELSPEVPKYRLSEEDGVIPRICAAITILQCLQSKSTLLQSDLWTDGHKCIYVYEADIPIEDIEQPTIQQVNDVWFTGELWVTKTHSWKKAGKFIIDLGERIFAKNYIYRYYIHEETVTSLQNDYNLAGYNNFVYMELGPNRQYLKLEKEIKK